MEPTGETETTTETTTEMTEMTRTTTTTTTTEMTTEALDSRCRNEVQGSPQSSPNVSEQPKKKRCVPKKRFKPKKNFKIPPMANPKRNEYVGESSYRFHYGLSPVELVRASRQYMYDKDGNEFLDCISTQVPVGHCHPQVVLAAQNQMATLAASFGFMHQLLPAFIKKIVETLPPPLCVAYLVNSGSEANDLALRLAQSHTKGTDVICMEGSFHGSTSSTTEVSAKCFWRNGGRKNHVHVLPAPELYRFNEGVDEDDDEDGEDASSSSGCSSAASSSSGSFSSASSSAAFSAAASSSSASSTSTSSTSTSSPSSSPSAASIIIDRATRYVKAISKTNRKISAFISEALMSHAGMTSPPTGYLAAVYDAVRAAGGVTIADEVQIGLGRVGEHFWAFQCHDVIPDIVTIGKPLGNGHPLAAVITTPSISQSCLEFSSTFGGNPVSCAVGLTLLEVMKNEKMLVGAVQVGKRLMDQLLQVQRRRKHVGDVRGKGMAIGVEIVADKVSKKPWRRLADELMYKMKERKVLVNVTGIHKNVITITPPLCFTLDNAMMVVKTLDELLEEIEAEEETEADVTPAAASTAAAPTAATTTTATSSSRKRRWRDDDIGEMGETTTASYNPDYLEHLTTTTTTPTTKAKVNDDDDDDSDDDSDDADKISEDFGFGGDGIVDNYEDMD